MVLHKQMTHQRKQSPHKKSKERRQRAESVLNDKHTVKDVVPSTETTKWGNLQSTQPKHEANTRGTEFTETHAITNTGTTTCHS